MAKCEVTRVSKSLRKQTQQICLKIFIALICCAILCLICFLVENYRHGTFMQHTSEKLIQIDENFSLERPNRATCLDAMSHNCGYVPDQGYVAVQKDMSILEEGSGFGLPITEHKLQHASNLEHMYVTTEAAESHHLWTVREPEKRDELLAKETLALEHYIADHKSQTIDVSAELTTTTPTSTLYSVSSMDNVVTGAHNKQQADKGTDYWFTDDYDEGLDEFMKSVKRINAAPSSSNEYTMTEYDSPDDSHMPMYEDEPHVLQDVHLPTFIEQLFGNFGRMSDIFAPMPYAREDNMDYAHLTDNKADDERLPSTPYKTSYKSTAKRKTHVDQQTQDMRELLHVINALIHRNH